MDELERIPKGFTFRFSPKIFCSGRTEQQWLFETHFHWFSTCSATCTNSCLKPCIDVSAICVMTRTPEPHLSKYVRTPICSEVLGMFLTYFHDRNNRQHNMRFFIPIENTNNSLHAAWWRGTCARHCCMKYVAHLRLPPVVAWIAGIWITLCYL